MAQLLIKTKATRQGILRYKYVCRPEKQKEIEIKFARAEMPKTVTISAN